MKRMFLIGVFINLLALIIGVTWIAPVEARKDHAEGSSAVAVVTTPVAQASVAPASVVAGGSMTVALNQWSITPQASQVAAGPVTFTVSNDGTITHEFVVMQTDTPAAGFHIGSFEGEQFRVNEHTVGTNVGETGNLKAGATKTITIDLKAGHYVFMCNLPAHYGLGMHTDFTVT
jgi:uncharacterized cupredoxin-like copper-binding protein